MEYEKDFVIGVKRKRNVQDYNTHTSYISTFHQKYEMLFKYRSKLFKLDRPVLYNIYMGLHGLRGEIAQLLRHSVRRHYQF